MDINLNDFQNICRTCMSTFDLIFIQNINIVDILQFLSGTNYSKTDELPQKLCAKCIQTMTEIQTFAFQCKQSHLTLSNCIVTFKNNQNSLFSNTINTKEKNQVEFVGIKQEVIDDINQEHMMVEELFEKTVAKEEIPSEKITISDPSEINKDIFCKNISNLNKYNEDVNNVDDTQEITNTKSYLEERGGERLYQCDICNKSFTTKSILVIHKATHNEICGFECDVCSKKFQYIAHLIRHKRIHSGERPYQCEICNRTFTNKSNLVTHKATHSDERRFECDVCGKGFKRSFSLRAHKRIHSGERPYQCDICNKTFTNKSHLLTHMTTHSDERRFECQICVKSFKQKAHLNEHKKIHSGERPHQCNVCQKTFTNKSHLVTHKATHSEERRFECNVCSKSFKVSCTLIRHKRIHSAYL